MKFTKRELKKAFLSTYFSRGEAYFRDGRVLHVDIERSGQLKTIFTSTVKGRGTPYTQEIVIKKHSVNSPLDVDGDCSCPVGYNCKHVVAACLEYMQSADVHSMFDDDLKRYSLAWLNQFSQSIEEADPAQGGHGQFLVYVLDFDRTTQKLTADIGLTKVLKRGGLSKGRSIRIEELCYYPPAYAKTVDAEVARLLVASSYQYTYYSVKYIQGKSGALALKLMLETGRCYWKNHQTEQPLQEGEPRELACEWEYDEEGDANLKITITPEAILVATDPPMYLDVSNREIGALQHVPYTASQLELLMQAPAVPASFVDEFSRYAALSMPEHLLAPPKAIAMEVIESAELEPRMLLYMTDNVRLARVRASYAGHELSLKPQQRETKITKADKIIHIFRDVNAETQLMEKLRRMGFMDWMAADTKNYHCSFNERNKVANDALWADFMSHGIPSLEAEGWSVEVADNFNMQLHEAEHWHADIEEQGNDWFSLSFDIEINQQKQALLPLITQVLEHYDLKNLPDTLVMHLGDGQYLQMPSAQIKPMLDIVYELYSQERLSDDGVLEMSHFDVVRLADMEQQNSNIQWCGGEQLRSLGKQLKDFEGIQAVQPPQGLQATLRDYQQQGLNWLQFLRYYHLNGILADDMGLGKTVQTLAHLLVEKEQGRMDKPCLVIAPTSLMGNWRREAALFAPDLKVLVLQGSDRHQHFDHIDDHDVVLSTYPLLSRDDEVLLSHEYHMLVLDEAQVVKNPKSKAAKIIRQFKSEHKVCLTGTPMENHLGELWALFDFLMPGFLGNAKQFNSFFRKPIENRGDSELQQRLVERVKPFMLRRSKGDVVAELPEKTEITRTVSLGKQQAALYESIRIAMEEKVRKTIATKGLARSHITILDALLKLRQVCCDPRILSLKKAQQVRESAKLDMLMEMLPKMLEEGRRILIFSQFTKMLSLIEQEIQDRHISYTKLTGQTRKRDQAIDIFKQGKADLFLISLKAGGVGLNLTEADTVIHYDPWWNPAAENQATDRTHRIGQDKAVFVYKLVVENSVEEKIIAMQEKKKALADAVYQQGEKKDELVITMDDMQALFTPLMS